MPEAAERAYFGACLVVGRLLRAGRYAKVRRVLENGDHQIRKHRLFYAPLLVALGEPLMRILDTGVRVLPQHEWEERERRVYQTVLGIAIRVQPDGTLVLPHLPGETLALLLQDPKLDEAARKVAITRAVAALRDLHRLGLTHGDAMAENVLVGVKGGTAHWIDFETVHDESRPVAWRRADDLRALLATCVLRTDPRGRAETLRLILDTYADQEVIRLLSAFFVTVWQRSLPYHLGQADLSFEAFQEIGRCLGEPVRR